MIKWIKNYWNKNKIRKRLILYFVLTILLMGITSIYTYYSVSTLMVKMNAMFTSNISLNELNSIVNKVEQNLEDYLSTKHSKNLEEYYKWSYELRARAEGMKIDGSSNESSLMLKDIKNMIGTYLEETDAAVKAKRGRNVNEYAAHYNEASKVFGYINLYINKLNNSQFQENTARYIQVAKRLEIVESLNIGIIITVIAFNIILMIWFTFRITRPIISLSHSADEISRGNFDVEQVRVNTHDEISVMANAFNRMASSIKGYIREITEKAELEGRLKEQELQNLAMKAHLKEAELQALQSQINPHFIFNTLNAGAQLAMLEGADDTCTFIENVANLFRYNLRKMDKPVTLREEIESINNYIYILKVRFADRLNFYQEIDESVLDTAVPCMILQPLVENAFIHGIGEMEKGGQIGLIVRKRERWIEIIVKDNGKGMDAAKINELLEGGEESTGKNELQKSGHTTGIGMGNVISRLRLFLNTEDALSIKSERGKGTEIIISLPLQKFCQEGEVHV